MLARLKAALPVEGNRGQVGVVLDEYSKLGRYLPQTQAVLRRLWDGVNALLRAPRWPACVIFADTFWFARHLIPAPSTGQCLFAHSYPFNATAHIETYRDTIADSLGQICSASERTFVKSAITHASEHSLVAVLTSVQKVMNADSALPLGELDAELQKVLSFDSRATARKYLEDIYLGVRLFPQGFRGRAELFNDMRMIVKSLLMSFEDGKPAEISAGKVLLPRKDSEGNLLFSLNFPERNGSRVMTVPFLLLRGLLAVQWEGGEVLDDAKWAKWVDGTIPISEIDFKEQESEITNLAVATTDALALRFQESSPLLWHLPAMDAHFLKSSARRKHLLLPLLESAARNPIKVGFVFGLFAQVSVLCRACVCR